MKGWGINVSIIEPGAYATEFGSAQSLKLAAGLDIYNGLRDEIMSGITAFEKGVPEATAEAVLKLVDAENPPLRLFLGSHALPWVRSAYADRLKVWEEWESVSNAAQGKLTK